MRAVGFFAILGAALVGAAIPPADARHSSDDAVASHFGTVAPGRFIPGRIAGRSHPNRGTQIFVLDRSSGRVVARDRRAFARSRHPRPFFGGELGGLDGFVESSAIVGMAPPSVVDIPQPVPETARLGRSQVAADLPPCRETTPAGVVIERGKACSHAPR